MDDPESPVDNDLYHIALACRSIVTAIDRVTRTGEVRVQSQAVAIMMPTLRKGRRERSYSHSVTNFRIAEEVLTALSEGRAPDPGSMKTARTYFAGLAELCDSARFGP